MVYSLYGLVCPKTNKIRYIGQTRRLLDKRLYGHFQEYRATLKHSKQKSYKENWFQSLGDDYKKITICLIEETTLQLIDLREKELIVEYKANGFRLTNIQYGGHGNHYHNEETRKKISDSKLGPKNAMFGKRYKKSDADIAKARENMIASAKFQSSRKSKEYREKISLLQSNPVVVLNYKLEILLEFRNCSQCANYFGYTRGNIKAAVRNKRQISRGLDQKYWVIKKCELDEFVNGKQTIQI